ncbi:hypothetical protein C0Q70_21563 [Pomacea canaliculata]|uniref:Uncharacterized protein n=1 Tax=Pomacea canaliculata TaxID=400727 RepID=A0A2T7NCV3_POMCA|nr:hypothetical protein C0Q70_21563 [Pomacea canaliculata]
MHVRLHTGFSRRGTHAPKSARRAGLSHASAAEALHVRSTWREALGGWCSSWWGRGGQSVRLLRVLSPRAVSETTFYSVNHLPSGV